MDRFVEKGMRKDEMKQATTKAILIDDGKDCLVIHVIQSQLSQYIIKVYQWFIVIDSMSIISKLWLIVSETFGLREPFIRDSRSPFTLRFFFHKQGLLWRWSEPSLFGKKASTPVIYP